MSILLFYYLCWFKIGFKNCNYSFELYFSVSVFIRRGNGFRKEDLIPTHSLAEEVYRFYRLDFIAFISSKIIL